jgi:hypothetical protein
MKEMNEKQNPNLEGMGGRGARQFLTGLFPHPRSEAEYEGAQSVNVRNADPSTSNEKKG